MNKKGFTLVELLAVIAILAILVIMAVPNVINLFNNAKVSTFISQAESLYKSAEQQVVANQMKGITSGNFVFCYTSTEDASGTNKLSLSGTDSLHYYIVYSGGKITSFQAEDGSYAINITNASGINLSDFSASEGGNYTNVYLYGSSISACSASSITVGNKVEAK